MNQHPTPHQQDQASRVILTGHADFTPKPPAPKDEDRRETLLRASYDFLTKIQENHAIGKTVFYDEAQCDGECLRDDIAAELDLPNGSDTQPLKGEWIVRGDHPLARIDERFTVQSEAEAFERELREKGVENITTDVRTV